MILPLDNSSIEYIVKSKEQFSDAWTKEMIDSGIKNGNLFGLIYRDENVIKGYVTYSISSESCDIECIYTDIEYRKQNIAYSLLVFLEQQLKVKGVKKILLEVRESNTPAKNLYKKFGFNKISLRKKYYSNGEDGEIYLKEF